MVSRGYNTRGNNYESNYAIYRALILFRKWKKEKNEICI